MAPRGKLLTRRVSIGDGAHRKKSHADGSSLFQRMSLVVGRSHFDPPNAAGGNEEHGKNRLVILRDTTPREGRAPQRTAAELSSRSRLAFAREEMCNGMSGDFPSGAPRRNRTAARLAGVKESPRRRRSASGSRRNIWRGDLLAKFGRAQTAVRKARRRISGVGRRRPTLEPRLNVVAPRGASRASS